MLLLSSPLHSERRRLYQAEIRREPDENGVKRPVVYLEGRPLDTVEWAINDFEINSASPYELELLKEGGYFLPEETRSNTDEPRDFFFKN